MNSEPFGASSTAPRRRALQWAAAAVIFLATVASVYWLTREKEQPGQGSAPPADEMAGMPGMASVPDTARSVTLSVAEQRRIGVTFAEAAEGTLTHEIRTVAQVTYDETRVSVVSLKIDGWVEDLFADATGQAIRKGDPLFTVYSPMLVTAEQELLLARQLARDVAGGSSTARAGADNLQAAALGRLRQWDVSPAEIASVEREGTPRRALRFDSPVSGIISEKNIVRGQRIMAGDVLYRIADLSTVWLDGEVFEQDLPDVHLGQVVTAEFAALPGTSREGRISYIYPTLNTDTRTAHVRVVLPNPGLALKPGMYATIRFVSAAHRALTVPRSSVLATGERNIVFVRDSDGRFVARDIVVGRTSDERVEVLRGLHAGETVVASGTFLVDAESNLDKALGGMGDMPGMSVKPPATSRPTPTPPPAAGGQRDHQNH